MASKISWFGGHMARTVRELKDRLKLVDMVIEVRDARIPFSSANPELEKLVRQKRRLVVLNKADLAASDKQQAILHHLQEQQLTALFTSSQKRGSIQKLLQSIMQRLKADKPKADMLMIMAIGIPNSGKSSLINALRHAAKLGKNNSSGGKAATGSTPGLTRHIAGFQRVLVFGHVLHAKLNPPSHPNSESCLLSKAVSTRADCECRKVGQRPTAFLMDTPGVMLPNVPNEEVGMRLALTGAVKDSVVSEERLVQHLLLELAHQPHFPGPLAGTEAEDAKKASLLQRAVVHAVGATRHGAQTSQPAKDWADDLSSLQHLRSDFDLNAGLEALQNNLGQSAEDVDRLNASYRKVVHAYRTGEFGRFTLDSLP